MQIVPTFYPTETPSPAEVVQQAERVISAFESLGPFMAVMFVFTAALVAIILIFWSSRNSNSAIINMMANNNAQKDKEIEAMREERKQDRQQHTESLSTIHDQMQRANDLSAEANKILKAVNDRGTERDLMQQQYQADVRALVTDGSKPVQEILHRVKEIADTVVRLDTRTADWPEVLTTITPLLTELNAFRAEAKKHSTQPLPVIVPPAPESSTP